MRHRLLPLLALATLLVAPVACKAAQSPAATPLGAAPVRGPVDAKVVILVFSDFACATCAGLEPALKAVRDEFPNDVQFVFKHNPGPEDEKALLAHEAAVEAGRQGKFWEMHDLLAANPAKLESEQLIGYARTLKLDDKAFAEALRARTHRAIVARDVLEAKALGTTGTLTLFINGRRGNGVPPPAVLNTLIKNLIAGGDGSGPAPLAPTALDLTGAPVRGAADAPVTIVEFSDFQCGFCFRANPTLTQLLERYPGKVRLLFKHSPIEGHTAAPLAHRAAFAAQQQGKFWEMHDRIFANQRTMDRETLLAHAGALGLDRAKFTADLDGPQSQAALERDQAEAAKVGVDGTPTFFINGTPLVGALPLEAFTAAVDKALAAPKPVPAPR
ncbi:MAG: thioredoxin domain-containing protein [Vicinamibacteraceae bacterium]